MEHFKKYLDENVISIIELYYGCKCGSGLKTNVLCEYSNKIEKISLLLKHKKIINNSCGKICTNCIIYNELFMCDFCEIYSFYSISSNLCNEKYCLYCGTLGT